MRTKRYTVRPRGMSSWASTDSLQRALRLAEEARDRGLRLVVVRDEETGKVVSSQSGATEIYQV